MDRTRLPFQPARSTVEPALDIRNQDPSFEPTERMMAPAEAPNVLVILLDDMGFGAPSVFGGPCATPAAEQLAEGGLRYNQFHTTALCSPTRAALLTGRNHHSVGMGIVTDFSSTAPGYNGTRPIEAGTMAHVLRGNGYATGAFGKWHQTPKEDVTPIGPFDRWPTGEGFERFYGFMTAMEDQFAPVLYEGTRQVDPATVRPDDYHLSADLVDRTVDWIREVRTFDDQKPWFAYLAFGATHSPHQVPREWQDRYRGQFSHGWDRQREITLARQKELGVVPLDAELAPWPEEVPHWEDLNDSQRLVAERLMEVYAAFAEHTDVQIGRLMTFLEERGDLENTLVLYILGDNGASAEGGIDGAFNERRATSGIDETADEIVGRLDEVGGPTSNANYPAGWALAMDTPFQWTKQVASHYGGTRNGMVAHWPAGITDRGGLREQWHHVIDVLPTVLESAGIPYPETIDGVPQSPVEGTSFHYSFADAQAVDQHTTQYFELYGNRGVYHDGWTAVTRHRTPWRLSEKVDRGFDEDVWELYDTRSDFSQARDRAAEFPEKLSELQDLFLSEARKFNVLPMDGRGIERADPTISGRPLRDVNRSIVLTATSDRILAGARPFLSNTSFSITVDLEVTSPDADGVLVCDGNAFLGWSFYLKAGVPVFVHNNTGIELTYVRAEHSLPRGRHTLAYRFEYDGGGLGKGGTGSILLDGEQIAHGRVEQTSRSGNAWLTVGRDPGPLVTDDYSRGAVNAFTDTIHTVTITKGTNNADTAASARQRLEDELSTH